MAGGERKRRFVLVSLGCIHSCISLVDSFHLCSSLVTYLSWTVFLASCIRICFYVSASLSHLASSLLVIVPCWGVSRRPSPRLLSNLYPASNLK